MYSKKSHQQGSFFAEVSASIAAIAVLTLISTNYVDSQVGRAQVSEAFVLMKPLVANVNSFYASHGEIGTTLANYDGISIYNNVGFTMVNGSQVNNSPAPYAGRYVKSVRSYDNGVVAAMMNPQFTDESAASNTVGKIANTQTAIQGQSIFLVPFLIGDDATGNSAENTSLRWACLTTINANPPTGSIIPPLTNTVINEQYFYAPGCVVISPEQANCLTGDGTSTFYTNSAAGTECANAHTEPVNWNETLYSLVDNVQ